MKTNRIHRSTPRRRPAALAAAALAVTSLTTLLAPRPAGAFGGEDPLNGNPWHHADITETAAKACDFTLEARQTLGWHADYVDSYLYNPLWWAPGGVGRLKASLSIAPELTKVHFDDLFATDRVSYMWRRYLSGTIAGLMWAKEHNDVSAAQNIVGVSLHAVQDFYSHSNWVDAKDRRTRTFLEAPLAERANLTLYTGSYEQPDHKGIKSHGKYAPAATVFKQPGVEQLMELLSSPLSPLQNSPMVQQYKAVKDGIPVRPYVPYMKDAGVKLPNNILYLEPDGIALDNTWLAEIGVQKRGLTDVTGAQIFGIAKSVATQASIQWLKRIETVMTREHAGDFWKKVKTTGTSQENREREYENFSRFPFQFVSAGPYPPEATGTAEEYYLRVRLKTSGDVFAGTNADIRLKVGNQETLLDYMPRAIPGLAHDDFEMGDNEVYVVGPFTHMPTSLTLRNDSPDTGAILKSIGYSFARWGETLGDSALNLIGGHADLVGTRKKIWTPEDLAKITTTGEVFTIDVDGGNEGFYRLVGRISKAAEAPAGSGEDWAEYTVQLGRMDCIKESKNDRGSNSDEPFLMALLSSLPGYTSSYRTAPFKDVDKGESCKIDYTFRSGRIPKKYGMLNLPICVMESDDETESMRRDLMAKFAGKVEDETAADKRTFLATLDSARAADWKLEEMEVYAWNRNGLIRAGTVFNGKVNRWIDGGSTATFNLDTAGFKSTGITTDELVAPWGETTGTPEPPSNTGNTGQPGVPPPGVETSPVGHIADMHGLIGRWQTTIGTTLTISEAQTTPGTPLTLHGSATKPGAALGQYFDDFYLRDESGSVEGLWQRYPSVNIAIDYANFGKVYITSLSADKNAFTGKVLLRGGDQFVYNGTRLADGSTPGTPATPGNGNTGIVPPSNNGSGSVSIGDGKYLPLDTFDVRLDSLRRGRTDDTVELFVTFRNPSNQERGLTAGGFEATLADIQGVGVRNIGDLYRASGDVPERISGTVIIAPHGEAKVRLVFQLSAGMTRLKTLTIREGRSSTKVIPISDAQGDVVGSGNSDGAPTPTLPDNIVSVPGARFQAVDDLDVRVDGIRRGRDATSVEVFVTVKNPTSQSAGLLTTSVKMTLLDGDGTGVQAIGNLYRATGDAPERIDSTVRIAPGGEAKVRYLFPFGSATRQPAKLTLRGYQAAVRTVDLPAIP